LHDFAAASADKANTLKIGRGLTRMNADNTLRTNDQSKINSLKTPRTNADERGQLQRASPATLTQVTSNR